MTNEQASMHVQMLIIEKQRQEQERKAVQEYAESTNPDRLLKDRIYGIIACCTGSIIDAPHELRDAKRPNEWQSEDWEKNIHSTRARLDSDPLFHRLVQMQAHSIFAEVEKHREGTRGRR